MKAQVEKSMATISSLLTEVNTGSTMDGKAVKAPSDEQ